MINQLLLGSLIIVVTVIIQVTFFNIAINRLVRIGKWLVTPASFLKTNMANKITIMLNTVFFMVNSAMFIIIYLSKGLHV
jgi:hypothetical protein